MFGIYTEVAKKKDYITVINGKWNINGKSFKEMTLNERNVLAEKIKS